MEGKPNRDSIIPGGTTMNYRNEYRRKLISAAEAAGLVKSGMWIDYGFGCGSSQASSIAHPDFRSVLQEAAVQANLITCGTRQEPVF